MESDSEILDPAAAAEVAVEAAEALVVTLSPKLNKFSRW
jgi:hypothetical protein